SFYDRVQQRMPRGYEGGVGKPIGMHAYKFKGDALVLLGNGRPTVKATCNVDHTSRDTGNLIASLLTFANLPTEAFEGRDEKCGDVARLKSAFTGLFHLHPHFFKIERRKHLRVECLFVEHFT